MIISGRTRISEPLRRRIVVVRDQLCFRAPILVLEGTGLAFIIPILIDIPRFLRLTALIPGQHAHEMFFNSISQTPVCHFFLALQPHMKSLCIFNMKIVKFGPHQKDGAQQRSFRLKFP